jgi:hypothetical protein
MPILGTAARPLPLRTFAMVSGWAGVLAGVLFVLFFALGRGGSAQWAWTGEAADAVGVVHLLTLAPVAWGLRRRMPASRSARRAGVAVTAVAVTSPVLQILIFMGRIPEALNVPVGAVATYPVLIWILLVSLAGHRGRTLPRPVTRPGLLIGSGLPVGVVLLLPGLVTPEPLRWVFVGAGVGIGVLAYLAIPIFPLLLARFVFRPSAEESR